MERNAGSHAWLRASTGFPDVAGRHLDLDDPAALEPDSRGSADARACQAPLCNPDGTAGTKYDGEQPQNSKSPASVSQYDAACSKQPS